MRELTHQSLTSNEIFPQITLNHASLKSQFNVKHCTDKELHHDLDYELTCIENNCNYNYLNVKVRYVSVRIVQHTKYPNSSVY